MPLYHLADQCSRHGRSDICRFGAVWCRLATILLLSLGWGGDRLAVAEGPALAEQASRPPNVLLICIDDLRNQLGYLGESRAQTPALDRFAETAVGFSRHYTHVPTCGASRAALMRGRYPEVAAHLSNDAILKTHASWADVSLPAWFRRHGYQTRSLGKVTHYPGNLAGSNWDAPPEELPAAWDRATIPTGPWPHAEAIMHGFAAGRARSRGVSPPIEALEGPDSLYPDAWVADGAIETLADLRATSAPWFFAVGFFKPHLPFAAPRAWFDRHDPNDFDPPANAAKPNWPSGWHASGEFRKNYGHGGRDPDHDEQYARELRRAYAASVSYMDHQLGRLLESLDRSDPEGETVVMIWGDHGFLLGEHAIWGKHCLYEEALRSPLLIRAPASRRRSDPVDAGRPPSKDRLCQAVVETIDLFPTLVDLADLPAPEGLSGKSLRPWLEQPDRPSDRHAIGFWSGGARTIRDDRWRLIRTAGRRGGEPVIELFDYENDPGETRNVAHLHPEIVAALTAALEPFTW